eukprot:m.277610 g.277610  ORF g.277610 m.277610 type:complete len:63 (-) comp130608_c0_seq1:146-334(-)
MQGLFLNDKASWTHPYILPHIIIQSKGAIIYMKYLRVDYVQTTCLAEKVLGRVFSNSSSTLP